ncbi:hypothetical protein XH83_15440 [Bradyrhizobium sp. CCBAU 53351]|uniref:hypothetical protein n=1 Tax=Bradyrhizobium sp. CCBAU 53351 TaxID=1325114 RepID=UPI0018889771|nr:hypothetical protein [Bradyrhizobium sp. CCBAU 53351]QOZ76723.1 hypothetical protein XH83_15440 [Bradyrhizobium sp. CCBAU 53351]
MTFATGTPVNDANPLPIVVTSDGSRVDYSAAATIANGQSLSAPIDLANHALASIEFPSAWTAAVITFQVSSDGVTYRDLWDENGEVSFQAAANRAIRLASWGWFAIRYLKIRSGTSAAPVAQAADRVVNLYSAYRNN